MSCNGQLFKPDKTTPLFQLYIESYTLTFRFHLCIYHVVLYPVVILMPVFSSINAFRYFCTCTMFVKCCTLSCNLSPFKPSLELLFSLIFACIYLAIILFCCIISYVILCVYCACAFVLYVHMLGITLASLTFCATLYLMKSMIIIIIIASDCSIREYWLIQI